MNKAYFTSYQNISLMNKLPPPRRIKFRFSSNATLTMLVKQSSHYKANYFFYFILALAINLFSWLESDHVNPHTQKKSRTFIMLLWPLLAWEKTVELIELNVCLSTQLLGSGFVTALDTLYIIESDVLINLHCVNFPAHNKQGAQRTASVCEP